ncbi:N5-carboxyaminoimidazole ribonucleotide synthase, partial [hydrothermal vent metagenome]
MKNYFSSDFKLGVLGGGQLGKMLLSETHKFDIYTAILDGSENAPCADICNAFYRGDLMDYQSVYNFGKKVDLLTIEIEHVNIDALLQLEKEGLTIYPQPKVLQIIQHKGKQKDFFIENNIPTAAYKRFSSLEELKKVAQAPFVWKTAQFGYDGTGVKVVNSKEEIITLNDLECIVENLIPFKNELAVIVARNANGETKTYPVVEMEFHPTANQVEYVICPARIDEKVAQKAQDIAL